MKFHLAGFLSALTTISGLALSVLPILPHNWQVGVGTGVAVTGVVLQAATKPVTAGDTALVPKSDAVQAGLIPPPEITP